jgi:uncharacterized membrane protein YhaH (DUF805 family)
MTVRSKITRVKQVSLWLWQGKYYIFSIVAVIITALYLTGVFTFYANTIAIVLSLAGLLIILTQQVLDAKPFADHKPNTFLNWFKSYPKSGNIVMAVGTAELASIGMKAHASVSISDDATLDRKVDFLLRQAKAFDAAIARVDDRVDELKSSLQETEKKHEKAVSELSASLKTIIAGHVVGSYDLNMFGITITICGTLIQFFSA